MATYKDIAEETGLSLATISKHYNGGTLREQNARAIEASAARLGFRPNAFARNLRSRRSRSVGVLLPNLDGDFYLSILAGVERRLRENGVSMLICADHQQSDSLDDAVEFLVDRMVDGIITVPTRRAMPGLSAIARTGTPIVALDWTVEGLHADTVLLDNEEAAAMAIQHFLDNGHTRIAYVGGEDHPTTRLRRIGAWNQLERRGITPRPEFFLETPLTHAGGRAAMQRLLLLDERPTAVLAATDMTGVGVLAGIHEAGLDFPGEMSFIGFDMPALARMTSPSLATIAQDVDEIARHATELMLMRLESEADPTDPRRDVVVHAALLPGGSVARGSAGGT